MKRIAIIPTLLTLGNAVCGFAAIVFASKANADTSIYFAVSAWLILGAMVFDGLDGYAARLSKTASDFGGQLDSLCDAISFGAAPAFLVLRLCQDWQATPLVAKAVSVVAALYLAFRLSYRSARRREVLRLAGDDFTVERVSIYGERAMWRFQPFWLRIVLEERADESNRLVVASHGRSLVIGDFLGAPMRRELAASLRAALARWRAALNPANRAL